MEQSSLTFQRKKTLLDATVMSQVQMERIHLIISSKSRKPAVCGVCDNRNNRKEGVMIFGDLKLCLLIALYAFILATVELKIRSEMCSKFIIVSRLSVRKQCYIFYPSSFQSFSVVFQRL